MPACQFGKPKPWRHEPGWKVCTVPHRFGFYIIYKRTAVLHQSLKRKKHHNWSSFSAITNFFLLSAHIALMIAECGSQGSQAIMLDHTYLDLMLKLGYKIRDFLELNSHIWEHVQTRQLYCQVFLIPILSILYLTNLTQFCLKWSFDCRVLLPWSSKWLNSIYYHLFKLFWGFVCDFSDFSKIKST